MKRVLLLLAFFATSFAAQAQLPDGSQAPDFTATDINGVPHNLQDYLDAGKTVIIDVSATWCGPCWNYHETHALDDLYYAYGPEASDEVVVLFIEGDPGTTLEDIQGTGLNTQGDWRVGSPYPIIDSGEISDLYDIAYFPTIYRVCPDGTLTEIGTASASALKTSINSGCDAALEGTQNNVRTVSDDFRVCDVDGEVLAQLKNIGTNAVTSATIKLKENETVLSTMTFNGTINQFQTKDFNFGSFELDPEADYAVEITEVNATTPISPEIANNPIEIGFAKEAGTEVKVHIFTDNFPGEIKYRIRNSSGQIVYTGGPYEVGPEEFGGGGPDANTEIIETITLPNETDCYRVQLVDTFGNGWTEGIGQHGLEIESNGTLVFEADGTFGASKHYLAVFKTTEALGTADNLAKPFQIYPNPSNGVFNIRATSTLSMVVSDMTGKVVYTGENITDGATLNLSALQSGMYIAKIKGATSESVEKLLIK